MCCHRGYAPECAECDANDFWCTGMSRAPTRLSPPMSSETSAPVVTVYWRPGCPFCSRLFRGLDDSGIGYESVDIWQQPDAAEFVRSVARGNETVPTVAVRRGDETVAMVNPPASDVAEAIARLSISA